MYALFNSSLKCNTDISFWLCRIYFELFYWQCQCHEKQNCN